MKKGASLPKIGIERVLGVVIDLWIHSVLLFIGCQTLSAVSFEGPLKVSKPKWVRREPAGGEDVAATGAGNTGLFACLLRDLGHLIKQE